MTVESVRLKGKLTWHWASMDGQQFAGKTLCGRELTMARWEFVEERDRVSINLCLVCGDILEAGVEGLGPAHPGSGSG